MPLPSKPLVPISLFNLETLDHAVRFLSTWSGSDKLFMIIQYTAKLVISFLEYRKQQSPTAQRLARLANVISDSRILWRLFGSLPVFQWMIAMERTPPPTRSLRMIEKLQAWSLIAYYAFEHAYWFGSHSIVPLSPRRVKKFGLWSTRFWAAYVVLQLIHLREDWTLLKTRARALMKTAEGPTAEQKAEIALQKETIQNELLVNMAYLPLTMHWSLESGMFGNEVWVGLLGLAAGCVSFQAGWKATAK